SVRRGWHVRAFTDGQDTVLDEGAGILARQFVLRCGRHGHIARHIPDGTSLDIANLATLAPRIFVDTLAAQLLDLLHEIKVDTILIHDIAIGVRAGDDLAAKRDDLFHGVDRHI